MIDSVEVEIEVGGEESCMTMEEISTEADKQMDLPCTDLYGGSLRYAVNDVNICNYIGITSIGTMQK